MAGKYKCLLCEKEFTSESGVKYHINSVHAEVRQAEWNSDSGCWRWGECLKKKMLDVCHVLLFPCLLGNRVIKLSWSYVVGSKCCVMSYALSQAAAALFSSAAFSVPLTKQMSNQI